MATPCRLPAAGNRIIPNYQQSPIPILSIPTLTLLIPKVPPTLRIPTRTLQNHTHLSPRVPNPAIGTPRAPSSLSFSMLPKVAPTPTMSMTGVRSQEEAMTKVT